MMRTRELLLSKINAKKHDKVASFVARHLPGLPMDVDGETLTWVGKKVSELHNFGTETIQLLAGCAEVFSLQFTHLSNSTVTVQLSPFSFWHHLQHISLLP